MERELQRLREADRKYKLDFAPMAENLEKKFTDDVIATRNLEQEINAGSFIALDCQKRCPIPLGRIKGSGGLYMRFGNNQVQDKINKAHLLYVKSIK